MNAANIDSMTTDVTIGTTIFKYVDIGDGGVVGGVVGGGVVGGADGGVVGGADGGGP